ncbi:MAG TPA: shikimate kinase [Acidimicrobiales bacterium]|nr:shikimate kinase [Acidimicrobiales bacterium]
MADRSHLVLVGMMGSGKTTVGRRVAARLGRRLRDSDAEVEARTGRTVREIFETDGEPAFRAEEARALAEALDDPEPAVVAAAGGVVLDPANRDRLRARGTVVWLDASPEDLARRVGSRNHRPLLGDDPLAALRRLDRERRALYEEVADHVVPVGRRPVEDVVADVLTVLGVRT